MDRQDVTSSMIKSIGWENGTLEVEFASNGAVYQYYGVSQQAFEQLRDAESVGRHFIANIKDIYPFQKAG